MSIFHLRRDWLSNVRGDLLAGLIMALALIPEAIAFSIIAGVDPKVGLYASFSCSSCTDQHRGTGDAGSARPGPTTTLLRTAAVPVLIPRQGIPSCMRHRRAAA